MTENKNYQNPEVQEPENDEITIDWMDILRRIIAIRKTLYKAAGVGVVLGIIIALSIPKQYTVTVTLSPEMNGDKASGGCWWSSPSCACPPNGPKAFRSESRKVSAGCLPTAAGATAW